MKPYTKQFFDFEKINGLLSPRKKLGLKGPAVGFIRLAAGEGYTFTHSHREQEELYIVIDGAGFIQIDNELIEIRRGDAIRVDPEARRALKGGSQGIFVICAGGIPLGYPKNPDARYLIDDGVPHYDDIPMWYADDEMAAEKNRLLAERMQKKNLPAQNNKLDKNPHPPLFG